MTEKELEIRKRIDELRLSMEENQLLRQHYQTVIDELGDQQKQNETELMQLMKLVFFRGYTVVPDGEQADVYNLDDINERLRQQEIMRKAQGEKDKI